MDDRYSEGEICTHAGLKFPAINVNTGTEIIELSRDHDVIGVDEAFIDTAQSLLQDRISKPKGPFQAWKALMLGCFLLIFLQKIKTDKGPFPNKERYSIAIHL